LFKPADKISFLEEEPPAKDTDLTFGTWGIGNGFYIVWPLFGPNTARSTVGLVGDFFLHPITYVDPDWASLTIKSEERLNDMSLRIGDYEQVKENALDPYIAIRNGYIQYRENQLKNKMSLNAEIIVNPFSGGYNKGLLNRVYTILKEKFNFVTITYTNHAKHAEKHSK